tara:strand:+ start:375 stop:845 length:471 start_codon:yes stop_codon:yes gene_type:complete
MATISDTIGFNKGTAAYPADSLNKHYRVDVILDFPKIIAARAAAGAAALTSTDVIQAIPVPAKTLVSSVGMEIITVGASGSLALGDGTAGAGYLAATVSTSTGMFGGVPVLSSGAFAPTLSGGKVYSAEDTIDVTLSTAVPSAAVVRVFAVMVDMS